MDVSEAIETRIEIREYADEPVGDDVKRAVLDAGRLASSGKNVQHWRFVLVDDGEAVARLGELSPTGGWVSDAAFAVAILTDPDYAFDDLDAGRAVTHMQLVAWEHGVGSCIYTTDAPAVEEFLGVPDDLEVSVVAGFGVLPREVEGRKRRKPLSEVASRNEYGTPLDLD